MANTPHEATEMSKHAEAGTKVLFRSAGNRKSMKQPPDMPWILNCLRPPAMYTRFLVMHRLGLRDEDAVSKLVDLGLIEPLGNRTGKQQMLFFGDEIEERAHDRRWMEKMVRMLKSPEEPDNNKKGS